MDKWYELSDTPSARTADLALDRPGGARGPGARIERFYNKLKHFRGIATRRVCRANHFLAAFLLANTMTWMC